MRKKIIVDQYNEKKWWIIKRYDNGNYYINQMVAGKMCYRRFARVSKRHLMDVIGL